MCARCGAIGLVPISGDVRRLQAECRLPAPAEGPGTELKKILDSLGIEPKSGCQCAARQDEMNRRGPAKCRETKAELLGWLKEGYDESTLREKAAALAMALSKGLPLSLEGVLDEAIRRSELLSSAERG